MGTMTIFQGILCSDCSKLLILFGGRGRNRTYNLSVKSRMLCQLSYASGIDRAPTPPSPRARQKASPKPGPNLREKSRTASEIQKAGPHGSRPELLCPALKGRGFSRAAGSGQSMWLSPLGGCVFPGSALRT